MVGTKHVLAFDIYGTLLNTNAIAIALQSVLGIPDDKAAALSLLWRRYQLEYTWRLNSMNMYEPFDVVTRNALQHALAEQKHGTDERVVTALMAAYNRLSTFDDALSTLEALAKIPNVEVIIFSNGTHSMVTTALEASSLAFSPERLFLADSVQAYKPATKIYNALLEHINAHLKSNNEEKITGDSVWLVSGNPFDVVGARNAGLQAIWVDRAGSGWTDRAAPILGPSTTIKGLGEIAGFMERQG